MNTPEESTVVPNYDLIPDDALAVAAKAGNHHARNALYLRHTSAIKTMVARPARMVARRSHIDSSIEPEDVVQQSFLIFCHLLDRWHGDPAREPFLSYLARLLPSEAAHFVRDKLHYRARASTTRLNPIAILQQQNSPYQPLHPDTSFEEHTCCLNPTSRRLINLRYNLSLSTLHIAALTGLTTRTVDRQIHAALCAVRLHISADFE